MSKYNIQTPIVLVSPVELAFSSLKLRAGNGSDISITPNPTTTSGSFFILPDVPGVAGQMLTTVTETTRAWTTPPTTFKAWVFSAYLSDSDDYDGLSDIWTGRRITRVRSYPNGDTDVEEGASPASDNQLLFQDGTYHIKMYTQFVGGVAGRARLRNLTDDTTELLSTSYRRENSAPGSITVAAGVVEIVGGPKVLEGQYRLNSAFVAGATGYQSFIGIQTMQNYIEIIKLV